MCKTSDTRLGGVCCRGARRLKRLVKGHNRNLIFKNKGRKLVKTTTQNISERGNCVLNVTPEFFSRPKILCRRYARFVFARGVHREGRLLRDHSSTAVIMPKKVNACRRFFRVLALGDLKQVSEPVILCGVRKCCSDVRTLLRCATKRGFVSESIINVYQFVGSPRRVLSCVRGCQGCKKELWVGCDATGAATLCVESYRKSFCEEECVL